MDQFVIKGRGEHRDKYLCYGRLATPPMPTGKFVYLPDQRKAARWDDPQFKTSGSGYRDNVAREYDGYFVRIVCRKDVRERVDELKTFIAERAANSMERPNAYWLDGDWSGDEGPNYCWACACKEVEKAFAKDSEQFKKLYGDGDKAKAFYHDAIRGGYSMEHDGIPHCANEECGKALDGTLTEYGADEELAVLTADYAPMFDNVEGWYCLSIATMNLRSDDPWWNKIAHVVDAAMEQERQKTEHEALLSASTGMSDARASLLGLLAARKEQKAPEPSYRLWDEFIEWRKRDRKNDGLPEHKVIEKRLIAEAKSFAQDLGFDWCWSWDLFMVKAPYGTYHWPFVVEAEQYRLWRPKAWQEGREFAKQPGRHSRDNNPYPDSTEESTQWDCGYCS